MQVSRHTHRNGPVHAQAVKRIFRYLNGTKNYQLVLHGGDQIKDIVAIAYSDASYAQCPDTSKGTTGLIISLLGSPIISKSTMQTFVTISACEAELDAIFECSLYIVMLRQLLDYMGLHQTKPTTLFSDSASAIALLDKLAPTRRSKHMGVRWHKVKELIDQRIIRLAHMDTHTMPADMMTKNLGKSNHSRHSTTILNGNLPRQDPRGGVLAHERNATQSCRTHIYLGNREFKGGLSK